MWLPIVGALLAGVGVRAAERPAPIVVIAHRGNHERAHENTVQAIRNAVEAGADYVEIDVRRTRDGHHVVLHDRTVDRVTQGSGAVRDLDFSSIRDLWIVDPPHSNVPPARIPSLAEALEALGPRTGLYLDFKDGEPEQVVRELRNHYLVQRTVVYLGEDELPAWRALDPALRFIVSLPDGVRTGAAVTEFLRRYPGVILDGPVGSYSPDMIQAAHACGSLVWPDIQGPFESPREWAAALSLGVDGLQTDHPTALIQYLTSIVSQRQGTPGESLIPKHPPQNGP